MTRARGASADSEREVVAVIRDVSERKAQEHAVEEAREEAVRANAAKSRFLATMSHELRTPLNAIIGFSEMLANEEAMRLDQTRRHEYATLIGESGHHLLSVVNGILDMSKIESGNFEITPEPFAPAPVIGTLLRPDGAARTRNRHRPDLPRPADLPDIVADKRADQADPDQSLVQRRSSSRAAAARSWSSSEVENDFVTLAVEDTGVGIAEDDLSHVGDPFFQVRTAYDRTHDGTGLGLSIVKGLVELHGGELTIRSRLGVGTRVAVRLPIDCERARPVEATSKCERLPVSEPAVASTEIRVRKRA